MLYENLQSLGARILRAVTPIALSGALIAAGCDTASPSTFDSPVELRASDGEPSPQILKHGDKIANAIATDEAFVELVGVAADVMGDVRKAQDKLSDEELDAIAQTTIDPSFAEVMDPGTLLGHLGGDPKDLKRMQLLVDELRHTYGLDEASPDDVRYVFELAFDTDEADDVVEDAVQDGVVMSVYDPCEQLCYNAYIAGLVVPLALFVIEMAVAGVTLPFGIIIAMLAIAKLNFALLMARIGLRRCLVTCDGAPPASNGNDLTLCGGDDLCEPDEYCWKGVLGIGKDECRPKNEQGDVCANDGQCLSDCCKLHVWSNPVSRTCRPANACN